MVPERGAKDTRASIVVGPDADLVLPILAIFGRGQRAARRPESIDTIKFPGGVCPSGTEPFHDRMRGLDVSDFVGVMGSVPSARHTAELEPIVVSDTVAVHGAVDDHPRLPLAMRFEDPCKPLRVLVIGKAFVMEDHIEPIGPLWIAVEFDFGFGPRTTLVNDRHIDVRGGFEALLDDLFLAVVVMATAPDDQQGSDRLRALGLGELT